jgi:hypothetical protein
VPVADWVGEEGGHNFMKRLLSRKQFQTSWSEKDDYITQKSLFPQSS